jgi:hypothetical protein
MKIEVIECLNSYANNTFEEISDILLSQIESNNMDFYREYKNLVTIGKNKCKAYEVLYESYSKDTQALVEIGIEDKQLFIINYTNQSQFFDISFDSVRIVMNSFKLK